LATISIDIGDPDLCAFLGEALADGFANTRTTPGDQGNFIF